MIGLEVPHPGVGGAIMAELFQRHILAVYTLNNERVIRLIPPLVITQGQLQEVLTALERTLEVVDAQVEDLVAE
jgi:putrescine aminotransferase